LTPLHLAAALDAIKDLQKLTHNVSGTTYTKKIIALGADVNAVDDIGETVS
jgi:hypothetical protein